LIDRLAAAGTSICYITHRFDELERTADRFVVLRDGRNAGEIGNPDRHVLLEMMGSGGGEPTAATSAGEAPGTAGADQSAKTGPLILDVENLSSPGAFNGVSLQVRSGEIVGLYGLVGAGRTEVALTLFGELPRNGGVVRLRRVLRTCRRTGSPRASSST
jgi:ABC-type sugar transport system ATPase subunit